MKMVEVSVGRLLAMAGLVLLVASAGYATPITVNVVGQVMDSDFAGITVGSAVTGSYTYDDAAGPYDNTGTVAKYWLNGVSLVFAADGSTVSSPGGTLRLQRDPTFDEYRVLIDVGLVGTGSFAGPIDTYLAKIQRIDPTHTALAGFPTIPDPTTLLTAFPNDWSVVYEKPGDPTDPAVEFDITSFSVQAPPIPVPGAVILGAIGATCTGWLRRRRTL